MKLLWILLYKNKNMNKNNIIINNIESSITDLFINWINMFKELLFISYVMKVWKFIESINEWDFIEWWWTIIQRIVENILWWILIWI